MTAIKTSSLSKYYGRSRGIIDINLTVEEGDFFGFIGPNGAGKSTTVKMLSGILYPDSGSVQVDGYIPYRQRREYVGRIGVVFGQKSQLQWDLPVIDSFELLKAIYRVPDDVYRNNLKRYMEMLICPALSLSRCASYPWDNGCGRTSSPRFCTLPRLSFLMNRPSALMWWERKRSAISSAS